MSAWVHPFTGLLPEPRALREMIAPPYDIVDVPQARALASHLPNNFLHITRAEIDLPDDTAATDPLVYQQAAKKFHFLQQQGLLRRDPEPNYYIYELSTSYHRQTGILALVSLAAYEQGWVRKHELTRPDKERDRTLHIAALQAQVSPVLLTYKPDVILAALLADITSDKPLLEARTPDGTLHRLWPMRDATTRHIIASRFAIMDKVYIADGHHRCAAAFQYASEKGNIHLPLPQNYCLAGLFPTNELQILAYHRVVTDLNGLSDDAFLRRLNESFFIEKLDAATLPQNARQFVVCLPSGHYRINYRQPEQHNPLADLDVSVLNEQILKPLVGINDIRRDERIHFIGGQDALQTIVNGVKSNQWRAGFLLYPTSAQQLLSVADKEQIMPPKSTWFEPKLADGLVCYPFVANKGSK